MRKIFLISVLICIYTSLSAQADMTKYKYCKAIIFESLDKNKNTLGVDSGQLFKGVNEMRYKDKYFVFEMDAINFLAEKGWCLVNTSVVGAINLTYFLKKPVYYHK